MMEQADRYQVYRVIYGDAGFEKLRKSKVLIVGAGGIGCEILKNMVLMGFQYLELIDLDTIDVSNLNRQFLFRQDHVDCRVKFWYSNIKNDQFDVAFFKSFDFPLIDSGSTGYRGQVRPILKGVTECYECSEKPTQKVYPICTIRSTPDKPVHCIVWAKEAFKLLFGRSEDSMLYEDPTVEANSTFMPYGPLIDELVESGKLLLTALFCDEIEKRLSTGVYENAKTVPRIISKEAIDKAACNAMSILRERNWDKIVWNDEQCATEAIICMVIVSVEDRYSVGKMTFDKDDTETMIFVTALANMRSRVFGIDTQSLYDAKGMAGNIIPAIATTNAIVAATQVEQACRIIIEGSKVVSDLRNTSVWRVPAGRGRFVLNPLKYIEEPRSSCFVCQKNPLTLVIDTNAETLDYLVTKVLKGNLGFNTPNVTCGADPIYEEGDDCDEDLRKNLPKLLSECPAGGIKQDTELTVDDFSQDLSVVIMVKHHARPETDGEDSQAPKKARVAESRGSAQLNVEQVAIEI
eukprot:GSChrysophyteH1.ASY1.ANO1.1809.1 assembled CDS